MNSIYREPIPTKEERAAKLKIAERGAERDRLRDMVVTIAWCFGFMVIGLGLMVCALHTGNEKWGQIFFWGALVVNNAGVMGTLFFAYRRGQERGDW
jgi:hypothetical protein